MAQSDDRKSFLEEAFEHRQRGISPEKSAADDDDAPPTDGAGPGEGEGITTAPEPPPPVEVEAPPADEAPEAPAPNPLPPSQLALVDEALKKSGLIWVQTPAAPGGRALWHAWVGDAIVLLTGGGEQPDPGLGEVDETTVVVRSKDNTARLVAFGARVAPLTPDEPQWEAATAELVKARLNLVEPESAPARWAVDEDTRLYRLIPLGPLLEGPGSYPDASGRAAPVPTTATTAGPAPKVVHRRQGRGASLS